MTGGEWLLAATLKGSYRPKAGVCVVALRSGKQPVAILRQGRYISRADASCARPVPQFAGHVNERNFQVCLSVVGIDVQDRNALSAMRKKGFFRPSRSAGKAASGVRLSRGAGRGE